MRLRVEPAMTNRARNDKSKARNDVPGHPGPDPGSGSSVCAKGEVLKIIQARFDFLKAFPPEPETYKYFTNGCKKRKKANRYKRLTFNPSG